jgi:hypothetical protein
MRRRDMRGRMIRPNDALRLGGACDRGSPVTPDVGVLASSQSNKTRAPTSIMTPGAARQPHVVAAASLAIAVAVSWKRTRVGCSARRSEDLGHSQHRLAYAEDPNVVTIINRCSCGSSTRELTRSLADWSEVGRTCLR